MAELIDRRHFLELAGRDPLDVVQRTRCRYDATQHSFTLPVWNTVCTVHPGSCQVKWSAETEPLHEYLALFAVHCLLTGRDVEPAGRWISEKDMPGGATFFRGPHTIPTQLIAAGAGNSLETFRNLCLACGGTALELADAAYWFAITDRIPVAVLYWLGDEEFPAEAKLLFDSTLPSHFALDIVFALAVGVCETLAARLASIPG